MQHKKANGKADGSEPKDAKGGTRGGRWQGYTNDGTDVKRVKVRTSKAERRAENTRLSDRASDRSSDIVTRASVITRGRARTRSVRERAKPSEH